jgi:ATP-dependent Lon protease
MISSVRCAQRSQEKELGRLCKLQPLSPEAGVLRGYLEWIADLSWSETSADSGDLDAAQTILDEDHFNMRKAKDRILEFIAVRQLLASTNGAEKTGIKRSILYFVGPPGTGKTDFHIHVPEGAIPKDGPSAGVAIAVSLLSTLCQKPPRPGIAMTGELTLTGRVLPIGGLKEKLLAAIRNGLEKVLLPADNRGEWDELDKDITTAINVEFVENALDAFVILFDKSIKMRSGVRGSGTRAKSK